jgi:hypothetical protein
MARATNVTNTTNAMNVMKWIAGAFSVALLLACDSGREPLAKGAEAEAQGRLADAAALYRAVCDKGSSLCPIAARQAERLKLKEAIGALDEGQYKKAKEALDIALASSDAGVKRAAEATLKLPDLEKGLVWEEASTSPNQDEALAKIEALAEAGVAISPKAKAWVDQNRPQILLGRVKAACHAHGAGSCVEAGRALSRLYPASPESAEAQKLVEAEYARSYALLQRADNLVAQWADVCDRIRACIAAKEEERASGNPHVDCPNEIESSYREHDEVEEEEAPQQEGEADAADGADAAKKKEADAAETKGIGVIQKEWSAKLEEIHDPFFVRSLEARRGLAEKDCVNDPETPPKPAGKK